MEELEVNRLQFQVSSNPYNTVIGLWGDLESQNS